MNSYTELICALESLHNAYSENPMGIYKDIKDRLNGREWVISESNGVGVVIRVYNNTWDKDINIIWLNLTHNNIDVVIACSKITTPESNKYDERFEAVELSEFFNELHIELRTNEAALNMKDLFIESAKEIREAGNFESWSKLLK
jgi:hypothetical protein